MRKAWPTLILVLAMIFVSACGLGMDTQDRLIRGQKALSEGEYRAAVIDAKNILLEEPNNVAARLLLGRASVADGDGVSAEKELRKAVELGTNFSDVLVDLGRAMMMQSKFEAVIAEIDPELATSEPDRRAAMRARGEAFIGLQRPVAAREVFTELLAGDADDISAQLGVVNSYIVERNYLQARETLNQVLASDDTYIAALQLSGVLSLQMKNLTRAAVDFGRAAELSKARADGWSEMRALSGLADAFFLQEKPDEARVVLQRMTEVGPNDLQTILATARLALIDEDLTTAQQNLQEILRRAPGFRPAQMLLGTVHKERGNLGQAEMYLSAVVAASPENSRARHLLAETRLALNKMEAAREVLEPLTRGVDADVVSLSMAASANLSLGDFDEAVELLERSVANDPENLDLKVQLAIAYFRAGSLDRVNQTLESLPDMSGRRSEFRSDVLSVLTQLGQGKQTDALEDAKSLRETWRGRAEAHNLVGSIEMSFGEYTAARKSFEDASQLPSEDVQSIRYLARLDEIEGDLEGAAERYQLILEVDPEDTKSMVGLARLSAVGENYIKAREWAEKARESDASAVVPRQILGVLLLGFREFSAAESVTAEALELDSQNNKLYSMMGVAKLNQGDFRGAEVNFGRALELEPGDPIHRLNLATSQAMRGNKASAIVTLQDSLEQTMRHLRSAVFLAALKADAGDLEGATDIARQLRDTFPNEPTTLALEAELKARSGNLVEASAAYVTALGIENTERYAIRAYQLQNQAGLDDQVAPLVEYLKERPFDSKMRIYLAQAYQGLDQLGKANREYERVLSNEPDNFIAANNLAWNYFKSGDSRAEQIARNAYELQGDNESVADTLGWILVKKGSLEEGIAMLRSAAELGDGRPEIRFHLAVGLGAAGQTEEAKTILQEILASDDEFSSRREAESLVNSL